MSNRPLIRPHLDDIRKEPAGGTRRKVPPPESTAAEAFYYIKQMNAGTPVVLLLNDGERLEGIIEWYDRMCIKLNRDDAPDLVVMKHAIRYMHKHEDFEDKGDLQAVDEQVDAAGTNGKRSRRD